MILIYKFFWDFKDSDKNYNVLLNVAYEFGKKTADNKEKIKLCVRKGREDDPINIFHAIFISKKDD